MPVKKKIYFWKKNFNYLISCYSGLPMSFLKKISLFGQAVWAAQAKIYTKPCLLTDKKNNPNNLY